MAEKGYQFSPKVCDEKWSRLSTQHRKYHDLSKKSGNNAIKWQYYKLMDEAIIPLGKKQSISPPKGKFLITPIILTSFLQYVSSPVQCTLLKPGSFTSRGAHFFFIVDTFQCYELYQLLVITIKIQLQNKLEILFYNVCFFFVCHHVLAQLKCFFNIIFSSWKLNLIGSLEGQK